MSYKRNESGDDAKKELVLRYEIALSEGNIPYFDQYEIAEMADWYASCSQFEQSQQVLDMGFNLHPDSNILLIEQAYLFLDLMKFPEAKEVINKVVDVNDVDVIILKAEIYLNEGNIDAAEKLLLNINKDDLQDIEVIQNVARLYLTMGYTEHAIKWLIDEESKHQDNDEFIALLADCYYQSLEDTDRAIYYYNKLIDKNPYNPEYWLGISKAYCKENNYEAALDAIDFALISDEKKGESYYLKATTYFQLENMEEAINYYNKAIDHFGISPEYGFTFIGMAYVNLSNWEKAIDAYQEAAKHAEGFEVKDKILLADIYSNMGLCFSKLELHDQANEACDKSIEYSPDNPYVFINFGQVMLMQNKVRDAYNAWEKACTLLPDADIYIQISTYLFSVGYVDAAIHYSERAVELNPDYPGIYNQLASFYIIKKDAQKFYEYNLKASPPIAISDIKQYLNALYPDQKDEYLQFIEDVKKLEESNT